MKDIGKKIRGGLTALRRSFFDKTPFDHKLRKAYEDNHGGNSLWFAGSVNRQPEETSEHYVARRYAQSLTAIFAALDTRKIGNEFLNQNRLPMLRLGAAFGLTLTLILSYGAVNGILANAAVFGAIIVIFLLSTKWQPEALLNVLTRRGATGAHIKAAAEQLSETLIRTSAADAPEDLRDLYRLPFVDTEGRPLSERLIETDLTEDYYTADVFETANRVQVGLFRHLLWGAVGGVILALMITGLYVWIAKPDATVESAAAAFSVNSLQSGLGVGLGDLFGTLAIGLFLLLTFGLLVAFRFMSPARARLDRRVENLEAIAERSIDQLAAQSGIVGTLLQNDAAVEDQIANAKADKTPFFKLGTSTGFLRARHDHFAPSHAGIPFGLSFNDLATHLIVLGGTGSGKTSGAIRPLIDQWLRNGKAGMLVLDGKGMLPAEIGHRKDYTLISPGNTTLNPIEGLSPDDVAETLSNLGSDEGQGGSDPYWNNAAAKLVRSAAHVAWVLNDLDAGTYNLATIYELISSEDAQAKARTTIDANGGNERYSGATARGVRYALIEFPKMPEKQRGSIEGIASLWLSQITDNERLAEWADAVKGFEIEAVTRGARVGVLLPEATYGKAGVLVAGLLKKRVYEAIKRRGDRWVNDPEQTPVLEVIDEVQELLTNDEVNMLPVARSLGLYAVFSTQNVDGILNKLGDHAGYQLLGNLRSMVAYQTQTEKTTSYIAERMGSSFRPKIHTAERYENLASRVRKVSMNPVPSGNDYRTGVRASLRTAGVRIADLGGSVLDFLKNPETRYRQIETSSSGNEFLTGSIQSNAALSGAENFERWGVIGQSLSLEPNVDKNEVNEALAQPNTALAQVIRGRVVRRDLIKTLPIFNLESSQ